MCKTISSQIHLSKTRTLTVFIIFFHELFMTLLPENENSRKDENFGGLRILGKIL